MTNSSLQQNLVPNISKAIAEICELNGSFQPQGMTEMNLVIQNVVWLNEYHTWKEIQVRCKLPHGQMRSYLEHFPSSVPTLTKLIGCLQTICLEPLCFIYVPALDGCQLFSFGLDERGKPTVTRRLNASQSDDIAENCLSVKFKMRANMLTMDAVYDYMGSYFHKLCFMRPAEVTCEYFRQVPLSNRQVTIRNLATCNTRQQRIIKSMAQLLRCDEDAVRVETGRRVKLTLTPNSMTCHLMLASHRCVDMQKCSHLTVQLTVFGPCDYPLTSTQLACDVRLTFTNLVSHSLSNYNFTFCKYADSEDELGDAGSQVADVRMVYQRTSQWMIDRKKTKEALVGDESECHSLADGDTACSVCVFVFIDVCRRLNNFSAAAAVAEKLCAVRWLRESLHDVISANSDSFKVAVNSSFIKLFSDENSCLNKRQKIYDLYIPVAVDAIGDIVRSSCDLDFVRQCHQLMKVTNTRDMEACIRRKLWSIASNKFNVTPADNGDSDESDCDEGVVSFHDDVSVQSNASTAAALLESYPPPSSFGFRGNVEQLQLGSRLQRLTSDNDFDQLTAWEPDFDDNNSNNSNSTVPTVTPLNIAQGQGLETLTGVSAGHHGDSDFEGLMDTDDLWLL